MLCDAGITGTPYIFLKKLIAIFALFGILLQTISQVVIVAEYYANKEYIAKNLCENRDKPKLHCDGKCCLKKKLAKEGKEQAPSSKNQKSEEVVNLFCADTNFELQHSFFSPLAIRHYSYNDLHTASFHHAVFHPPTA